MTCNADPAINNVSGLGTAFIRTGQVEAVVRLLYKTSQPPAAQVFCQNTEDQQLLVDNRLVPRARLTLLPGPLCQHCCLTNKYNMEGEELTNGKIIIGLQCQSGGAFSAA